MKKTNKMLLKSLLVTPLLVVTMILPRTSVVMAAATSQATVNLGTASNYAILAGSTITNTGNTTISGGIGGDVGLHPGTDFIGRSSVSLSGAVHIADEAARVAKEDLIKAYDDADGRLPVTRISTELGGTTLTPGTYDSADGTFQITGTLTLDAQGDPNGVFVFKTASTLITASDSSINLINSARFCRTFWKVGSSATLGTNSHFAGHIFALESITANNGATVQGQLLARNGAVTLENNTITNGICATTPSAILHVIKHVINDNGGTDVANDFTLKVKTSGIDVATAPGDEYPGTTYTLEAGTYAVSEGAHDGYTASYSGDSDTLGNITLAPGDNKTVTINNDDNDQTPPVVVTTPPAVVTTPPVVVTTPPAIVKHHHNNSHNGGETVGTTPDVPIGTPPDVPVGTTPNVPVGTIPNVPAGTIPNVPVGTTPNVPVGTTPNVPVGTTPNVTSREAVTKTVTGGQLPKTSTHLYELLLLGVILASIGVLGWISRKRYE